MKSFLTTTGALRKDMPGIPVPGRKSGEWREQGKGMDPGHVHGCLSLHDCLYRGDGCIFSAGGFHSLPAGRGSGRIPDDRDHFKDLHRFGGPAAKNIFLIGSFVVLFSTLFAALAIRTRVFSDLFGVLKWIDFSNMKVRMRTIRILAIVFPVLWTIAFLVIRLPVLMVTIGGIATFVMLIIVVIAGVWFRFRSKESVLEPGGFYKIALVISCTPSSLWGCMA